MLTPVGVTTEDYIDALKADSPVHIKMTFASQGITLTDQDVDSANALTLNDIMNGDIDLTFGRAVMKQMTIGILNTSRVSGLIWTDEFTLELGVEINGTTNYVKIGTFVGEKPNNVTSVQVINFTAYDYMGKFDKLVDDYWTNVNFPASVETIYHGLCNYVGVGYISGDELPNIMSRMFTTAPAQLQGYTCRDLLAWIAEACGCYAKINADGNCKMVWYTDHSSDLAFALDDEFHIETADLNTGLTWDEFDEYYWNDADKLEWNDVCSYEEAYMIDSLQVKQLGADIDICYPYETDGNVYMIVENPFLSVESISDITDYIQPLYDRLIAHGGHLPMSVQCIGNYLVETGDIISVDVDGVNTLIAPVYARTLRWYGACRDEYETTGDVERVKVSSENREKLIARNNIRIVAKDLYYNRQSGIEIDASGITVSGSRFVKIESGGTFDVDSSNFKINSSDGYMKSGNWTFDDKGITYQGDDDERPFMFRKWSDRVTYATGIYYNLGNDKLPRLSFVSGAETNSVNHQQIISFISYPVNGDIPAHGKFYPYSSSKIHLGGYGAAVFESVGAKAYFGGYTAGDTANGDTLEIYPASPIGVGGTDYEHQGCLEINRKNLNGAYGDRFITLRVTKNNFQFYIEGAKLNDCSIVNSDGSFYMYPRTFSGKYIKFEEYTYNGTTYTKIWGNGDMIFEGTVQSPSSRDIKHDIQNLPSEGDKIDNLTPVSFVYDNDGGERRHNGLIYEDVINIMPEICSGDETSKGINYVELIPVLLKEIKDLRYRVKALERGDN